VSKGASPAPTWLSTAKCAAIIGVTTDFIRGEIIDGRLRAYIIQRPGKRRLYRVRDIDFRVYLQAHWKHAG
jgi:hypothetical protein